MRSLLIPFFMLTIANSCSSSSNSDAKPPTQTTTSENSGTERSDTIPLITELPAGETEAFKFDSSKTLGKDMFYCKKSGYGFVRDEKLNKIAACCVYFDDTMLEQGKSKFVSVVNERVVVKPESCSATIISGEVPDISMPIDINLTNQKYVTVGNGILFVKASNEVSITGAPNLETKLVGASPLYLYGKSKVSSIHSLGTSILYELRDASGYNDLQMKDVKIEGSGILPGGLWLSADEKSTKATSAFNMKFERVTVTSDKPYPVILLGYPFDLTGLDILPGKKYAPHALFRGEYTDTTGIIKEKRFPIVSDVHLKNNSKLVIESGAMIKVPVESKLINGGTNTSAFYSIGDKFDLILNGSVESPVVVTSIKDDSIGGDTNGDGSSTLGSLVGLVGYTPGKYQNTTCKSMSLHGVRLIGSNVHINSECDLTMGNVAIHPSQSGETWSRIIDLGRKTSSDTTARLTFDSPVTAWQSLETFVSDGKLSANAVIFSGSRYNGNGGLIKGIEHLTVHNTSSSPNKITANMKVLSDDEEECKFVMNSDGQRTDETKLWTHYIEQKSQQLMQCK